MSHRAGTPEAPRRLVAKGLPTMPRVWAFWAKNGVEVGWLDWEWEVASAT